VIDIACSGYGVHCDWLLGPAAGAINKKHPPSVGGSTGDGCKVDSSHYLSYRSPVPNQEKSLRLLQPRSGYFSQAASRPARYFFVSF
jgi:hypothetical protein